MRLSLQSIQNKKEWKEYHLPSYDPEKIAKNTIQAPQWIHFGAGNIFRAFPAVLCQRLIEQGKMNTGIICCESYDNEIITKALRPYDNLTVAVTLNMDGTLKKEIVGSISHSLTMSENKENIVGIFKKASLQIVSFTITEKGYSFVVDDMDKGPKECKSFMAQITAMCLERGHSCKRPLALVSMDNCSHNGEKLQKAVMQIAQSWLSRKKISQEDYNYLEKNISFPWSMIDKITPHPHPKVEEQLIADGLEEIHPFITAKHTYIAPFVNAEKCQYLVLEDKFPNGRPPLEDVGVIFTDRDTVDKVEKMKVCTCLNPLHTCLAIYGCLLGYTSIAEEMKDRELNTFIYRMSHEEGITFVTDPKVINPTKFLNEVLTERFPNPFLLDTPQRIATDTSQKISIRYGETIKAYMASNNHNISELKLIPLVLAGWIRYLIAINDLGEEFEVSPDPLYPVMKEKLKDIKIGSAINPESLHSILSNVSIFGVDLYECGLAEKVIKYFEELIEDIGAVRKTLQKYLS